VFAKAKGKAIELCAISSMFLIAPLCSIGVDVWDPEGRHYYDFLSAYSALNQGNYRRFDFNTL
jgi:acetylornithine/succinyldiaminopimelate/putrescine aminotransferase